MTQSKKLSGRVPFPWSWLVGAFILVSFLSLPSSIFSPPLKTFQLNPAGLWLCLLALSSALGARPWCVSQALGALALWTMLFPLNNFSPAATKAQFMFFLPNEAVYQIVSGGFSLLLVWLLGLGAGARFFKIVWYLLCADILFFVFSKLYATPAIALTGLGWWLNGQSWIYLFLPLLTGAWAILKWWKARNLPVR